MNAAGQVGASYTYDAFGNLLQQSGTAGNAYQYQTKQTSSTTGLVYFGARYYNPLVGRWLTQDPAGMIDGPNMYVYLGNNPLNLIDAWGLCGEKAGWDIDAFLSQIEDFSNVMAANPMSDGTPLPFEKLWLIGAVSSKTGRVFWSGSEVAMMRARKFAEQSGRVTLEMTKAGQRLVNSMAAGRERWGYASSRFAKGAEGVVHVFHTVKVASGSIWKTIEEPILRNSPKVKEIIEHIIKQ